MGKPLERKGWFEKMKKIVIGMVAHVDAGKTTLSESILYQCGTIRHLGRVDDKDTFFDTDQMERSRGITIFSKQAQAIYKDHLELTLLDTPGHVDFSAEMERTLKVLDYAVLVISGSDGVQGHTRTLWRLLKRYQIPVFIFVNKMDLANADPKKVRSDLEKLDSRICDFTKLGQPQEEGDFFEKLALSGAKDDGSESPLMEHFLQEGHLTDEEIAKAVKNREIFPMIFGSARNQEGTENLLDLLERFSLFEEKTKPAAMVYKIDRDQQNNRLTHVKILGGSFCVKDLVNTGALGEEEKINEIRRYHGEKFEGQKEAHQGEVVCFTGLSHSYIGQGLGDAVDQTESELVPVLTYKVLAESVPQTRLLSDFLILEEEDPSLHVVAPKEGQDLSVQIMGEVQIEILLKNVKDRFGYDISFEEGKVLYLETIDSTVEGVGHYEPLRHYAEVHVVLSPLESGSGRRVESICSLEQLSNNYQKQVLSTLEKEEFTGTLLNAPLVDVRMTLVSGRSHIKHTEGGDFYQATIRAIRQGLMQAKGVLLEPYYQFYLELPNDAVGRAMTDIDQMSGNSQVLSQTQDHTVLSGEAPVSEIRNYNREVITYTRGEGRLELQFAGYRPCHNTKQVLEQYPYDPVADLGHPSGSVFCSHGAGFYVDWNEVPKYMHLPSYLEEKDKEAWNKKEREEEVSPQNMVEKLDLAMGTDEIDEILRRAGNANKKKEKIYGKSTSIHQPKEVVYQPKLKKDPYLLVDGYNVIFASKELGELAKENLDGARGKLMDELCNYQGYLGKEIILVFDAYRVENHEVRAYDYQNIHVVFTKMAQTADAYIESFSHEHHKIYDITVATSDGLEQIIIRGHGSHLISSRELLEDMERTQKVNSKLQEVQKNYLLTEERMTEILEQLEE